MTIVNGYCTEAQLLNELAGSGVSHDIDGLAGFETSDGNTQSDRLKAAEVVTFKKVRANVNIGGGASLQRVLPESREMDAVLDSKDSGERCEFTAETSLPENYQV